MAKRNNREVKFNISNNVEACCGTTDRKNPKVVYLTTRFWISPKDERMNVEKSLSSFSRFVRFSVGETLKGNKTFSDKHIVDVDANPNMVTMEHSGYCSISIHLLQRGRGISDFMEVKDIAIGQFRYLLGSLEYKLTDLGFNVNGKKCSSRK